MTARIAVCADSAADLASLEDALHTAGGWQTTSIVCRDASALAACGAELFVLSARRPYPEDIVDAFRGRREGTALIVIGEDACRRMAPSIWVPRLPPTRLLATLIQHHLREQPGLANASTTWRRKGDMIIGHSPAIRRLLHVLDQLAPAQTPVIVTGESGVGKELVAQALHYASPRAKEPFIAVNCAAIPENLIEAELFGYQRGAFTGAVNAHVGAIEAANNGTLFLDEIGEMPTNMQAKLLRVLETFEVQRVGSNERKQIDFRLVSATNRNLEAAVAAGRFREDLYYRIQVYPLHIPPLRERVEDIPAIATHHLSLIAQREQRPEAQLTTAALEKLVSYAWPGNVRELVNLLERAVLVAGSNAIDAEHILLPSSANTAAPALLPYRDAKHRFEVDYYSQLLRTAGGNISRAATLGQKTRKEIYDAIKRLDLDTTEFRDE